MATAPGFDGEFDDDEEARVHIDTTRPVSLETVGRFLEILGREVQAALGDPGLIVELAEYREGSINFLFRKRRRREEERDARDKRMLDLAEAGERRGRRMELCVAISLALSTPDAAVAALELMDEGRATTIQIEQVQCTPETLARSDLLNASEPTPASDRHGRYDFSSDGVNPDVRPTAPSFYEKQDMLRGYEDGQQLDLAGRIMPRRTGVFRTASNTKLPILGKPDGLDPGRLVRIRAEVQKGGPEIGIIIHEFERLDDP